MPPCVKEELRWRMTRRWRKTGIWPLTVLQSTSRPERKIPKVVELCRFHEIIWLFLTGFWRAYHKGTKPSLSWRSQSVLESANRISIRIVLLERTARCRGVLKIRAMKNRWPKVTRIKYWSRYLPFSATAFGPLPCFKSIRATSATVSVFQLASKCKGE